MAMGTGSRSSRGGSGSPAEGAPPRGSNAASGLRRRRTSGAGRSGGEYGGESNNNTLRFSTDALGLQISPRVVLMMGIFFIGFVAGLHLIQKLYTLKNAGGR